MILTNKQALTTLLSHVKDNICLGKVPNLNVAAEDLVFDGLKLLLQHHAAITLEMRNIATNKFIEASKLGSAMGMFLEGIVRLYGFGCKQNLELGNALIIVAAKSRQELVALHFVGINLLQKQQIVEGLDYLQLAAHQGFKESAMTLGYIYIFKQDLVPTSYVNGIKYLQLAGSIAQAWLDKVQEHVYKLNHAFAPAQTSLLAPQLVL
jgi:hypothetical protein